ncbi:sigma-54-dependent transcriptional regulator [Syntrophorhabdus aromaticivorans]|uniref:Sigma-54-dependent Fis family transcriptional regulator n=1 Tax=Syntrophorhabdus aromaticivorans TaxID=328301 RepID=A0A351U7D7_9BACT|nr:sigma-54 dependent transcriptional regulator [Syntrophorhabdus aromaticivorans]NLW36438.1 sigma-54-dependent Fis family transcriptional regulator [Syntrophorhabdus aromaticivorans]HBA55868.1 sigma-54-dependent Fis family transcriptional regulator [Syntrophorhabdus aromaticivorans]
MDKILVIDDDQAVCNYLNIFLLQAGIFDVTTLSDSTRAHQELRDNKYDILLLDMDMPEVTGLDILKIIQDNSIDVETIVLTGVEDINLAVSAMKLGAIEYLTKPVDNDRLLTLINTVLEGRKNQRILEEEIPATSDLKFKDVFKDTVTQNEKMLQVFSVVEKMAQTDSSILIWGESGTGKELIARAIHKISKRNQQSFVAVNAGVFANELFTSEFFGYNHGAFTGATANKRGFLEEADKGTLFLDEIGELALPIQVKLLRVLQEGEFFRLGSTKNLKVDVRIVAATNKNLQEEIKKGNFRKDLFYRLNMNSVYLPPLRDRKGDVQVLAYHFLKKFCELNNKKIDRIADATMKLLSSYDYPGNVRELMNIINSAVIIESTNELRKKSLPNYFLENTVNLPDGGLIDMPLKTIADVEKDHIKKILSYTRGNKTKAAQILGISRVSLLSKVRKYKLE